MKEPLIKSVISRYLKHTREVGDYWVSIRYIGIQESVYEVG